MLARGHYSYEALHIVIDVLLRMKQNRFEKKVCWEVKIPANDFLSIKLPHPRIEAVKESSKFFEREGFKTVLTEDGSICPEETGIKLKLTVESV